MPRFTFGQIEALLAEANDIAADKRQAFSARLKHLQRQGLRGEGSQPGRGRVATLSFSEVMQLALAVELLKAGLPPQRAALIVRHNWRSIRYTVYLSTLSKSDAEEIAHAGRSEAPATDWLWLIRADALAELTKRGEHESDVYEAIETVEVDSLARLLDAHSRGGDPQGRRTLLVHGSALTRAILHQAAFRFRFAEIAEMREDILQEERDERTLFTKFSAEMIANRPPLSEEQRAKVAAAVRDFVDADAAPRSRLETKARALLRPLSAPAIDLLLDLRRQITDGDDANVAIGNSREAMIELCENGFIEIAALALADPNNPLPQMEISPLGLMAMNLAAQNREQGNVSS